MSDVQEPVEGKTMAESELASGSGGPVVPASPAPVTPDEPPESPRRGRRPRRHPPSLFWPLVLVGAGVILLMSNLGYLPWQSWTVLWRLWPLLLIAIGIDLLIGRRSMVGAVISAVLILLLIGGAVVVVLFAQNIPALVEVTGPVEWRTEHIEYPLEGLERASVAIDYASVPGYLSALSDSPNLIEGDITYRGRLEFDVGVHRGQADVNLGSHYSGIWLVPDFYDQREGRWDVQLSPKLPLDLVLDAGSGRCDLDLSGLQVAELRLDAGSGAVDLVLPSDSSFDGRIDSGSGRLTIAVPESVGMRIELSSGSGAFRPDKRFRLVEGRQDDEGVWETEGFRTAQHKIVLKIDQGSGSINIR